MRNKNSLSSVILLIFFVSGLCSLIYEVIWVRHLTFVFGATNLAVSSVLAVFMAGLALGSFYFGRLVDRSSKPLLIYSLLEIGIGIFALFIPFLIPIITSLYIKVYPFLSHKVLFLNLFRFSLTFLILIVPTLLMGGTLPVIGKFLTTRFQTLGRSMGTLYFVNTIGGAIGSLLAGFFLLKIFGVRLTIFFAAFLNIMLGILVILLYRRSYSLHFLKRTEKIERRVLKQDERYSQILLTGVLITFAISGFSGLAYEVLWTRVLVFIIGNHVYAFTTMLTTFLFGIALGSILFARLSDSKDNPAFTLSLLQIGIGISAILLISIFYHLPYFFQQMIPLVGKSWWKFITLEFIICFLIMIIPTTLMGGTFPLVIKIYTPRIQILGRRVGVAYMLSTLGAIGGSLVSGFVLIPWIGIQRSIITIAFLNLSMGILILYLATSFKNRFVKVLLPSIISILIIAIFYLIPSNAKFQPVKPGEELIYYDEGSTGTLLFFGAKMTINF